MHTQKTDETAAYISKNNTLTAQVKELEVALEAANNKIELTGASTTRNNDASRQRDVASNQSLTAQLEILKGQLETAKAETTQLQAAQRNQQAERLHQSAQQAAEINQIKGHLETAKAENEELQLKAAEAQEKAKRLQAYHVLALNQAAAKSKQDAEQSAKHLTGCKGAVKECYDKYSKIRRLVQPTGKLPQENALIDIVNAQRSERKGLATALAEERTLNVQAEAKLQLTVNICQAAAAVAKQQQAVAQAAQQLREQALVLENERLNQQASQQAAQVKTEQSQAELAIKKANKDADTRVNTLTEEFAAQLATAKAETTQLQITNDELQQSQLQLKGQLETAKAETTQLQAAQRNSKQKAVRAMERQLAAQKARFDTELRSTEARYVIQVDTLYGQLTAAAAAAAAVKANQTLQTEALAAALAANKAKHEADEALRVKEDIKHEIQLQQQQQQQQQHDRSVAKNEAEIKKTKSRNEQLTTQLHAAHAEHAAHAAQAELTQTSVNKQNMQLTKLNRSMVQQLNEFKIEFDNTNSELAESRQQAAQAVYAANQQNENKMRGISTELAKWRYAAGCEEFPGINDCADRAQTLLRQLRGDTGLAADDVMQAMHQRNYYAQMKEAAEERVAAAEENAAAAEENAAAVWALVSPATDIDGLKETLQEHFDSLYEDMYRSHHSKVDMQDGIWTYKIYSHQIEGDAPEQVIINQLNRVEDMAIKGYNDEQLLKVFNEVKHGFQPIFTQPFTIWSELKEPAKRANQLI